MERLDVTGFLSHFITKTLNNFNMIKYIIGHRGVIYKIRSGLKAYLVLLFNKSSISIKFPVTLGYCSKLIIKDQGKIKVGKKSMIYDYVEIQSRNKIKIGNHFSINNFSRIVALNNIEIGDNVTIAQFVTILDHDHDFKFVNHSMILEGYKTKPISIGNNVWIADKVTILKGVNIGNNVIIGANSLVNKDIPDNSIAAGNPCSVIKFLKNE